MKDSERITAIELKLTHLLKNHRIEMCGEVEETIEEIVAELSRRAGPNHFSSSPV
jgi:hypothetical protein